MWADQLPEKTRKQIEGTRVIHIHRDVMDLATSLVSQGEDKVAKVAPFAVWPDYETWVEGEIECEGGLLRFGVLFSGLAKDSDDEKDWSVKEGVGALFVATREPNNPDMIPVTCDLTNYSLEYKSIRSEVERLLPKTKPGSVPHRELTKMLEVGCEDPLAEAKTAEVRRTFKPILVALLALMNSPKLIRVKEHDMEKFNKRRIKRGKYPYFPHHEIELNIDKSVFSVQRGQDDGPERCLHFVRAHPRFYVHPRYKQAEVTIVQPHWRGNPELGIKDPSYRVGREESDWPDKRPE